MEVANEILLRLQFGSSASIFLYSPDKTKVYTIHYNTDRADDYAKAKKESLTTQIKYAKKKLFGVNIMKFVSKAILATTTCLGLYQYTMRNNTTLLKISAPIVYGVTVLDNLSKDIEIEIISKTALLAYQELETINQCLFDPSLDNSEKQMMPCPDQLIESKNISKNTMLFTDEITEFNISQ